MKRIRKAQESERKEEVEGESDKREREKGERESQQQKRDRRKEKKCDSGKQSDGAHTSTHMDACKIVFSETHIDKEKRGKRGKSKGKEREGKDPREEREVTTSHQTWKKERRLTTKETQLQLHTLEHDMFQQQCSLRR